MNQSNPFNSFNRRNLSDDLFSFFKNKSILSRLILINLFVFIITTTIGLFFWFFNKTNPLIDWLSLPADYNVLIFEKPWSLFSYMFTHASLFHFFFNMLWLYFFGILFNRHLESRKILGVYLLGGFSGAFLFMLAYNLFPVYNSILTESIMVGSSAAVMAIVFTISFYVPNYAISLIFLGKLRLKHIALIIFILDILSIGSVNSGGHIAHIGGALLGLAYGYSLRTGKDFLSFFHNALIRKQGYKKSTSRSKKTQKMSDFEYNQSKKQNQDRINEILDKISERGYDSLTKDEKETLFKSKN